VVNEPSFVLFNLPEEKQNMAPKTSRDLPGPALRRNGERDTRREIVEDAAENEGKDRDLVHGDGGTLELPVKPGDISKDD
jgi:hypothetical protein